jgi:hypothetical protein
MIVNTKRTREAWLEGTTSSSNWAGEEKDWNSLWKVKVPSKIHVFLWRLAKQSISVDDVRHRMMEIFARGNNKVVFLIFLCS